MATVIVDVAEQKRLNDAREAQISWKKWGPYFERAQGFGGRTGARGRERSLDAQGN